MFDEFTEHVGLPSLTLEFILRIFRQEFSFAFDDISDLCRPMVMQGYLSSLFSV